MPRTSERKAIWYSDAYVAGIASTASIATPDCTGVTGSIAAEMTKKVKQ